MHGAVMLGMVRVIHLVTVEFCLCLAYSPW